MADITANVDAWSSTEGSNSPTGATTIGTGLDDNLRAIQAGVVLDRERASSSFAGNLSLAFSVGSSALTIALKGKDGSDPSSTNKVIVPFRNVTAATGDYSFLTASAATSVVVSSGSTLGTANSTAFRLWVVAFNDGGTLRLGVINCRSGVNTYPLSGWGIASATAEGGAGGADSAQVFYAGAAVTSKAYTVLGYATYESGLGTAGTWSAAPTRAQLYTLDTPLPGAFIQTARSQTGAVATGTTTMPFDDTIPQNDEGDEYLTQAITPTSAANLVDVAVVAHLANSASVRMSVALFQDSTANALAAIGHVLGGTGDDTNMYLTHRFLAGTTSATTLKVRAGGGAAGTTTFNGQAGARTYGGVDASSLTVSEVMA